MRLERISYIRRSLRRISTTLHLHSTADMLFFEAKYLDIIESHVDDPLYASSSFKKLVEERDKFLKVSICRTSLDHSSKRNIEKELVRESPLARKLQRLGGRFSKEKLIQ